MLETFSAFIETFLPAFFFKYKKLHIVFALLIIEKPVS